MLAFIIIFAELGGWTSVPTGVNPHALIGLFTTLLAFIQPIMAHFRPHPGTPKRYIFNWAHWFVGNTAHLLSCTYSCMKFKIFGCQSFVVLRSCLHLSGRPPRQSCLTLFSYLAASHILGDSCLSSCIAISKFFAMYFE